MAEELDWLPQARERDHQITGFAVTLDFNRRTAETLPNLSTKLIGAFKGPYPRSSCSGRKGPLDWDAAFPEQPDAISTWSFFEDSEGVCLIEGEFYADAWGYRPKVGDDARLAPLLRQRLKNEGPSALRQLNGAFSGWFFDQESGALFCFVDPVGIRALYYRWGERCIEIASNLYGLSAGKTPLTVDPLALQQQLVFGEPMDGRTLFSGVKRLAAGKALAFSGNSCDLHRYYHFPRRDERGSLKEKAESLCASMEAHVDRMSPLIREGAGIALSGGKDSRLILASLLSQGIQPHAYLFYRSEEHQDFMWAQELCRSAHIPCSVVRTHDSEASLRFFSDASVLMEGLGGASPFLLLAALSTRFSSSLLTGRNGSTLSGSFAGFCPWSYTTVDQMALAWLNVSARTLPAEIVNQLLRDDLQVPGEDLKKSWLDTYRGFQSESEDPLTVFIMGQIEELRTGSPIFQMMRFFTTPIHPYADLQVLDAYLRLPPRFLAERRAHSLAARLRYPEFGLLPTAPSGIALRHEHLFHPLIAAYRQYRCWRRRNREQNLRIQFQASQPTEKTTPMKTRQEQFLRIIQDSPIVQPEAITRFEKALLGNPTIKLERFAATTVAIACAQGRPLPEAPPLAFLSPPRS